MLSEFPIIKTNRLLLRRITESDLENIYLGLSNPDVIKYYGISFDSLEASKEQLKWFSDLELKKTGIWWAICSLDNRTFFGAGGLNDLSLKEKYDRLRNIVFKEILNCQSKKKRPN